MLLLVTSLTAENKPPTITSLEKEGLLSAYSSKGDAVHNSPQWEAKNEQELKPGSKTSRAALVIQLLIEAPRNTSRDLNSLTPPSRGSDFKYINQTDMEILPS